MESMNEGENSPKEPTVSEAVVKEPEWMSQDFEKDVRKLMAKPGVIAKQIKEAQRRLTWTRKNADTLEFSEKKNPQAEIVKIQKEINQLDLDQIKQDNWKLFSDEHPRHGKEHAQILSRINDKIQSLAERLSNLKVEYEGVIAELISLIDAAQVTEFDSKAVKFNQLAQQSGASAQFRIKPENSLRNAVINVSQEIFKSLRFEEIFNQFQKVLGLEPLKTKAQWATPEPLKEPARPLPQNYKWPEDSFRNADGTNWDPNGPVPGTPAGGKK